jgi:hypothetical protein
MRQQMGYVWYLFPVAEYEALKVTLREKLGDSDFNAAWAEGAALSTEEAIAYALRGRGDSTSSDSSPTAFPTRTSPPACSYRRGPCSRTSATSTTNSA